MKNRIAVITTASILLVCGCQSAYYGTMEKFGYHKRDILVDRVGEARDAEEEAKDQFKSALEEFTSVVNFSGGKLEEQYNLLKSSFDKSQAKADAVHGHIKNVERVAEWYRNRRSGTV